MRDTDRRYTIYAFPYPRRCIGLYVPIVVLLLCVEASGHCEPCIYVPRGHTLTPSLNLGNTLFSIFLLCERNAKVKRVMIGVAAISYAIACAMLIK